MHAGCVHGYRPFAGCVNAEGAFGSTVLDRAGSSGTVCAGCVHGIRHCPDAFTHMVRLLPRLTTVLLSVSLCPYLEGCASENYVTWFLPMLLAFSVSFPGLRSKDVGVTNEPDT